MKIYDAIIIGSGASGGMAAKELTDKGLEVLVLEAGPPVNPLRDLSNHQWPWESVYRNMGPPNWRQKEQWMQATATTYSQHFYVKDSEHPYTTEPGQPFQWVRARIVGGKTLHWGRASWRFSDLDFKAASHDGFGDDWPIEYKDVAQYYDRAEEFIGVCGDNDNISVIPNGKLLPGFPLVCHEQMVKKGAAKLGRAAVVMRMAMLTKVMPQHLKTGRAVCHYCGNCQVGCDIGAMFNSVTSSLAWANLSGRMTLRPNSVVRNIIVDKNNAKAKGVAFVDRVNFIEHKAYAKMIIVAASTLESTRLLLNSKSSQHPNGLGNSSEVLGHYVLDHIAGSGASAVLPTLKNTDPINWDGKFSGIFVPRFRNLDKQTKHDKFIRGYNLSLWPSIGMTPGGAAGMPGFGANLKEKIRAEYPARVYLGLAGEMLARKENYVELDPNGVVDAWGVPVLKMHIKHSDNERAMNHDGMNTSAEILEAAGAESITPSEGLLAPGRMIHEMGGVRMGNDKKTSVLNKFNQMHDVKNVFVTDASAFVSSANQNPTLTILALTIRACDYAVEELKRGNL